MTISFKELVQRIADYRPPVRDTSKEPKKSSDKDEKNRIENSNVHIV